MDAPGGDVEVHINRPSNWNFQSYNDSQDWTETNFEKEME